MDGAKRSRGQPLKYKEAFYLQHLHSEKYLTVITRSENELALELCQIPGEGSVFKIDGCYEYQMRISSYIKFTDPVYLNKHIDGRDAFLYYQKNELNLDMKSKYFEEFGVSYERRTQLQVFAYEGRSRPDSEHLLRYGDVIWFYHIESSSFLASGKGENMNTFLMDSINTAQNSIHRPFQEARPRIEVQRTSDEHERTILGMWQVEGLSKEQGGIVPSQA
jgi:hypothetical protein